MNIKGGFTKGNFSMGNLMEEEFLTKKMDHVMMGIGIMVSLRVGASIETHRVSKEMAFS